MVMIIDTVIYVPYIIFVITLRYVTELIKISVAVGKPSVCMVILFVQKSAKDKIIHRFINLALGHPCVVLTSL